MPRPPQCEKHGAKCPSDMLHSHTATTRPQFYCEETCPYCPKSLSIDVAKALSQLSRYLVHFETCPKHFNVAERCECGLDPIRAKIRKIEKAAIDAEAANGAPSNKV